MNTVQRTTEIKEKIIKIKIKKSLLKKIKKRRKIKMNGKEILSMALKHDTLQSFMTAHDTASMSERGFIYEAVCILIGAFGLLGNTKISLDNFNSYPNIKAAKSINDFMNKPIQNHDGPSDVTLLIGDSWVPFTIKYRDGISPKDCEMDQLASLLKRGDSSILGVIVKNKEEFIDHKFQHEGNIHKTLRDSVVTNNMIFGFDDISAKYLQMKKILGDCDVQSAIDLINENYLNSRRQHLVKRLHQRLFELQFERNLKAGHLLHLLHHKCRAGKSISILLVVLHLMKTRQKKRILITTGVGATIEDYIDTINKFHTFKDLDYYRQGDFESIEDDKPFILFTSNQYLKVSSTTFDKTAQLNKMNFDVMVFDESHQGGSTLKTHENIISQIKTDSKLVIYASATGRRTKCFYSIPECCVYRWSIFDEAQMKITSFDTDLMIKRHGPDFEVVNNEETLDRDYSKCPVQIQIRPTLDETLVDMMNTYNIEQEKFVNGYGFEFHRLFDLQKKKTKGFKKQFAICATTAGEEMLKKCLELIISSNPMSNSIMKTVERTQSGYNSRKSTRENPQLFLMYLPIKTQGSIGLLMETLVKFLEKHNLWKDYQIEYNCGTTDSSPCKQKYNEFISSCMLRTQTNNKKGCILLLGNKGNTGITYPCCDVTISLDNCSSLDRKKQADSRSLNPADGKTVSINVDLNLQRTMMMINDKINNFKTLSGRDQTTSEILRYFVKNKIFLVNPQEINFGIIHKSEINKYCEKMSDSLRKFITDDAFLLDSLECDDDLESILKTKEMQSIYIINKDLEGKQKNCPQVGQNKILLDIVEKENITEEERELVRNEVESFIKQNKTKQLLKRVVPLLGLLHRVDRSIITLEDVCKSCYKPLLENVIESEVKDLAILSSDYIIKILHKDIMNNNSIIQQIRELYLSSEPDRIRELVENHFIPSRQEHLSNAEVPTPQELINEMMANQIWGKFNITSKFWTQPKKCLESCCGKGNFVLALFDKFMKELPDTMGLDEKCRIVIEDCLYFGDITPINVFITQELLKCHAYMYCKKEATYKFNSFVGNSLELSLQDEFGIETVDLVIGNPPYHAPTGGVGSGNTIWQEFVKKSLNSWLKDDGLLCFVHPPPWRKPNSSRGRFNGYFKRMSHENRLLFLSMSGLERGKRVFNCGTRFDWYIIQRGAGDVSTLISDDDNKEYTLDLKQFNWLPNSMVNEVELLIGSNDEERCNVIYSASAYEHRKPHMRHEKDDEFKHQCIHSTPQKGARYMWSNRNDKGHFGVKKIIFGEAGINEVIIDFDGEYGLTNSAIGIEIESREEGELYKNFLESDNFKKIMKACSFSNYRVDRCVFNSFKKRFYTAADTWHFE